MKDTNNTKEIDTIISNINKVDKESINNNSIHDEFKAKDNNKDSWEEGFYSHDKEQTQKKNTQNNEISSPERNNTSNEDNNLAPILDGKQNINTIKSHFNIKNLYLPPDMSNENELEKLIMNIFYNKYDMPLKYSKIEIDENQIQESKVTYTCKIGFKYVTDAVKLYDKEIFIEYRLFPFKSGGYNFEPSSPFKNFVIAHKERMKTKEKPVLPIIKRKRMRSNSRNAYRKKDDRSSSNDRRQKDKKADFNNNISNNRNTHYGFDVRNERDRETRDNRETRDTRDNRDTRENRDTRDGRDVRDNNRENNRDYREQRDPRDARDILNNPREIKDIRDTRETREAREIRDKENKEKRRIRKSRSRSRSRRSTISSMKSKGSSYYNVNKHSPNEKYNKKNYAGYSRYSNENYNSNNEHIRSVYIIGLAENCNMHILINQLKLKGISPHTNIECIPKVEDNFNNNYYKLSFENEKQCSKMIESNIELGSNVLLVLPCMNSKSLDEMLTQYQVVIKGKEKDLANIDFSSEISSVYRFFCNYGKIVDFNLEFLPNMIYITYKQKSSVKKLTEAGILEYINKSSVTCRFIAAKNDFPIYVRNLKDSNKTYENFIPRRPLNNMICNPTFNPFNSLNSNGPGIRSLLNGSLISTLDQNLLGQNQLSQLGTGMSSNLNSLEKNNMSNLHNQHGLGSGLNSSNFSYFK